MNKGVITTYVLVFGAIFLLLLSGLLGFILLQLRHTEHKLAWHQSLYTAEAGFNYYRWCLNNEIEQDCETEKNYYDLSGNLIGSFSIEDIPEQACGEVVSREVISTGKTDKFPDLERKINVFYGRESVAKYAYLLNDNVWAGESREIKGLYHSNAGIRMDGENQSLVTSARETETWRCNSSFGCCPSECSRDGSTCRCPAVFTTTNNSSPDLFEFPTPPFDFEGITVDLAEIKGIASGDHYWPPVTDIDTDGKGYHIKFLNNGTFEVWIITKLKANRAYSLEQGWHDDYSEIEEEYLYSEVSVNPDCSLIFVEDNLWLEGEVKGKTTIVSANLADPNKNTDIVLSGNIDYALKDGSDSLTAISQNNLLIGPDSPDEMELRGVFIAQKGYFGRKHYWESYYYWDPGSRNIKEKLEIAGSVVSNGRVGTQWTSGSTIVSGYKKRENYIDSNLIYNPSPFTPFVTSDFEVIRWQEIRF